MKPNVESRLVSETIPSGLPSRESLASDRAGVFVALSALVTEPIHDRPWSTHAAYGTEEETIKSISIIGAQRIEPETIRSYVNLRPGHVYDEAAINKAIRDLLATELLADVDIRNDSGALNIIIKENPVINRIVFEGNKRFKYDKILKELKLAPRQIFTQSKVRADVSRIVELYHREGHFAATAEPKLVNLKNNLVDIVFEISEGPKKLGCKRDVQGTMSKTFKSLGFFQDKLEIVQRPAGEPDRVVLEATIQERTTEELPQSRQPSSLEHFILNAAIQFREKGKEFRALVDLSEDVSVREEATGESTSNLTSDDDTEREPSLSTPIPDSSIIATKIGIEAFLDRESIGLRASYGKSTMPKEEYVRGNLFNIDVERLINLEYPLSFERSILSSIYKRGLVNEIQSIISAERCLKFDNDSIRKRVLTASLESSLEPVFEEVGYPVSLRANYVDRIVDEILSYHVAGREPWAARVVKNVSRKRPPTDSTEPLPETAPAIWKVDKDSGDTPPDFIKRHYRQWLRTDSMGLTRPDIKRLDPSLYMALANWLRKNELPEDCPVPVRSERVNAELDQFLKRGIGAVVDDANPETTVREARRLASAIQRRR